MSWQNCFPERATALLTVLSTTTVVACGSLAIHDTTMGLQVVSTESARRLAISRAPRALPPATLDLPASPRLADWLRSDGRITIAAFIYARCVSVCSVIGSEFQQMQAAIDKRGLAGKVRLLSISFDPDDGRARLAAYAEQQKAKPGIWRVVGIASAAQREAVLDTFGIVVLPAPLGEFSHNAAFHIVDRQARLAKIVDFTQPEQALEEAAALSRRGGA